MDRQTILRWLRRIGNGAEDLLFPDRSECVCCGGWSGGAYLCGDCVRRLEQLQMISQPARKWLLPPAGGLGAMQVYSAWMHVHEARQLVLKLKFRHHSAVAGVIAPYMAEIIRPCVRPDTVITWAATAPDHVRRRGWDHGAELARAVAKELGRPCEPLLERVNTKHLRAQRGLTAEKRMKNVLNTYASLRAITEPVILVDDVITTGATAWECVRTLQAAGCPDVRVLTATQAVMK